MLCTPVFIFTSGSSALFRVPTLWFMDLTVATCHIQYTFLSLGRFFFFTRKRTKQENTRSSENGRRSKHARKALILRQPLLGSVSVTGVGALYSRSCPGSFDSCMQPWAIPQSPTVNDGNVAASSL